MGGALLPVETGLVQSLARPGTNVTGTTWDVSTTEAAKRLELFKQLVPSVSRMAHVWDPKDPGTAAYWPDVRSASKALGMTADSVPVSDNPGLERAFAQLTKTRPSAVFFWSGPFQSANKERIFEWVRKSALPTVSLAPDWVEGGFLMAYAPSMTEIWRQAAGYVDKILRGAKPEDLAVSRPSKFVLTINAKTARALSLTIPPSLLIRADRIIE
jgi:putative tryptophan/tyrosine transport system substrate-binding protein